MTQSIKREQLWTYLIWPAYFLLLAMVLNNRFDLNQALLRSASLVIPQFVLVYVNLKWLIPRFFVNRKYLEYFLIILLMLLAAFFLYHFLKLQVFEPPQPVRDMRLPHPRFMSPGRRIPFMGAVADTLMTAGVLVISLAYKTSQLALKREQEATELKNQNLQTELKFLKSQINPHFLFNALHNIYSLSVLKSERTPEMLLILSDMLRYMLYDCNTDYVPIAKEIHYIENYISLIKLKDEVELNIQTNFDIENEQRMLAPLLFIPFVENSFKHSKIEDLETGWVKIEIKEQRGELWLRASNSISESKHRKDQTGGIGLENVKRRLSLLYPDQHELKIQTGDDRFEVQLRLLI